MPLKKSFLAKLILVIITINFIYLSGCEEKKEELIEHEEIKDTIEIKEPELIITYHLRPIEGLITLTEMEEEFGEEGKRLILALNRLDSRNLRRGDSLVIPDTLLNDIIYYSPFPDEINSISLIPKILFISRKIQSFAAYEYGRIVHWGPTSTGKKSTPTPKGLYHTNWKAKKTVSTVNEEWILPWAFNLDNFEGISLHQYDLPGYPASHACARLLEEDAQWIYYWADQWILTRNQEKIIAYGTPVIIFDDFNYSATPPWKYLTENPDTTNIPEEDLDMVIEEYYDIIKKRVEIRDSVLAVRDAEKLRDSTNFRPL